MAARLNNLHQADVRLKIRVSQLLNVLQRHALDPDTELALTRIKAIEILLRKALPDLVAMELNVAGPGLLESLRSLRQPGIVLQLPHREPLALALGENE